MSATFIIAILGCFTGFLGLLIQLLVYARSLSKLKVKVDPNSNSYFFKSKDFEVKGYEAERSAVVSLIIRNNSTFPITIDDIFIDDRRIMHRYKHINEFKFVPKEIKTGENQFTYYAPAKPIQLPQRMDVFDTIFVSARFPFFDDFLVNDNNTKIVSFKLYVSTPRKKYKCKVKLYEYTYYHDHFQELHRK